MSKAALHGRRTYTDFVCLWDSLGNANNQANLVLDRLDDSVGSVRRRHVQHRSVWLRLANGLREMERNRDGGRRSTRASKKKCFYDLGGKGGETSTSFTDPNTGKPRCVWPAFFGETPPTILVPNANASFTWKVPCSRHTYVRHASQ
jgi:hypothetical protein